MPFPRKDPPKPCHDCKQILDASHFYQNKKTGLWCSYCKACHRQRTYAYYKRRPDVRAISQNKWREKNPERSLELGALYRKRNPGKGTPRGQQWRKKYPERLAAHNAVTYAIRKGTLIRPTACEWCGTKGAVQGHHADYSKPLSVEWLCAKCHLHETLKALGKLKYVSPNWEKVGQA